MKILTEVQFKKWLQFIMSQEEQSAQYGALQGGKRQRNKHTTWKPRVITQREKGFNCNLMQ